MNRGLEFLKRTPPLGPAVRILLLEDDPISVEIVGTYLRRIVFAEVELHTAVTVADALALLAQADVELVVADLHLPDSAGAATVERLVHATDCPVIAITADLDPKLRDATLACGAFEFLQKGDLTEATLMRLVRLATMQARTYRSLRESKEAETALRESEGRFRNLARFGQSAVVKSEPAELVARAASAIFDALSPDAVAYIDADPGTGQLSVRTVVAREACDPQPEPIRCGDDHPIMQVMASGRLMLRESAELPFPWARDVRRAALVPVRTDDKVCGVLCICCEHMAAFGAEEINFRQATASVLSTALQRIESEARLAYLAQFDPLTGLPNRALLADRFSQMIVQAKRRDCTARGAVHRPRRVQGGERHARPRRRRRAAQGDRDAAAIGGAHRRHGGAHQRRRVRDRARTSWRARRTRRWSRRRSSTAWARRSKLDGKEVFVTASVGIAAFPADGADAETLIGAADAAMYRAKQVGPQRLPVLHRRDQPALARPGAARRGAAARAGARRVRACPTSRRSTSRRRQPSGAEALLRWKHPERGMVSPDEFIPVLEETGLIVPVGDWVLRRACEDLKAWQAAGARGGADRGQPLGAPVPPAPTSMRASSRWWHRWASTPA